MRSECAWCGKDLGDKPGPEGAVTHGICEDCMKAVLADFYGKRNGPTVKGKRHENLYRHDPV